MYFSWNFFSQYQNKHFRNLNLPRSPKSKQTSVFSSKHFKNSWKWHHQTACKICFLLEIFSWRLKWFQRRRKNSRQVFRRWMYSSLGLRYLHVRLVKLDLALSNFPFRKFVQVFDVHGLSSAVLMHNELKDIVTCTREFSLCLLLLCTWYNNNKLVHKNLLPLVMDTWVNSLRSGELKDDYDALKVFSRILRCSLDSLTAAEKNRFVSGLRSANQDKYQAKIFNYQRFYEAIRNLLISHFNMTSSWTPWSWHDM